MHSLALGFCFCTGFVVLGEILLYYDPVGRGTWARGV